MAVVDYDTALGRIGYDKKEKMWARLLSECSPDFRSSADHWTDGARQMIRLEHFLDNSGQC